MFIIFGWGKQTVKEHGPAGIYHCEHCNNDRPWTLFSRRTWITLFFIPVIPYSTEYLLLCPICGHGARLDARKFNEIRPVAENNRQLAENRITQAEYDTRMEQLGSLQSDAAERGGMAGKTETQLNYIRQMKEIEEERKRRMEQPEGAETE